MSASDISNSVRIQDDVAVCEECGSTSRVGRGLCLNCMLRRGLGCETEITETLEEVLDEIDVRDADWRIGNYQILEEIGRGGMGVIYRARQRHSRRIVALKRILSYQAESQETLVRFRREAEASASLDHPNVLPIYEVSEGDDGLPFFSMKFAVGGSLSDAARSLRDDPRSIIALMAKVTRAMQYAHLQGILHRDLKPGNILLDGRGEPLVSDFGLAKWLDTSSDLTRTLTIFGTPGYIAPEQAQGTAKSLTPAADIYSIGAVLFDLFTGRTPFLGEHALAVIKQASEKPAPKLRTLAPVADRDVETICAKCLEREPQARYRSAGDLAEDLERWLVGRPIVARPVSSPVRIWRWSKRNPKLAGSVAAAVVLGAIGMIAAFTSSRLSSIVQNAELARHSIVVMPFEDLDDLSTNSSSAKEVTNGLASALANTKSIRLNSISWKAAADIDPGSVEDWKELGQAANARFVLSGSIRQRQGKQRVAVHLVETATGSVLSTWVQDTDSLAEIAKTSTLKISGVLGVKPPFSFPNSLLAFDGDVSAIGGTSNPKAREYCERGKDLFSRYKLKDVDAAVDLFRTAIELDPNYALAYALLGSACQARAQTDNSRDWRAEGDTATKTALRLAPMLPEAYRARTGTLRRYGQLRAALDPCLTAYELEPSSARTAAILGDGYELIGRPDLAIGWFEKANRRETQPLYADNLANAWADLGNYDKAKEAYTAAIVFKGDLPVGLLGLSAVALYTGDYQTARGRCEEARLKFEDNPQPLMMAATIEFFSRQFDAAEKLYREALKSNRSGGVDFMGSIRFLSALGFIEKRSPARSKEGKALLEEARTMDNKELETAPENSALLYSLAANDAALGNTEAAVLNLKRAVETGWIDYHSIQLDPRFDSIRNNQAFKDTLTRLTNNVRELRRQMPSRNWL
jgi:serine/threonine protein kinase/Tfp pilus assembly protein PilF